MLNEAGDLVKKNKGKPRHLMPPLPQSLPVRQIFRNPRSPSETIRKVWSKEGLSTVVEVQVKYLNWANLSPSGETHCSRNSWGWCHWKATLNYPWNIIKIKSFQRLEESKYHSYSRRARRKLRVGQSHLSPWEDNGETDLGNQFLHTCRTRQSEIPNRDLQRGNHA